MKKDYEKSQSYPTDLTDEQWLKIASLFVSMREHKYSKRELVNAVLYLVDNGCKFSQVFTEQSFYRRARRTLA